MASVTPGNMLMTETDTQSLQLESHQHVWPGLQAGERICHTGALQVNYGHLWLTQRARGARGEVKSFLITVFKVGEGK